TRRYSDQALMELLIEVADGCPVSAAPAENPSAYWGFRPPNLDVRGTIGERAPETRQLCRESPAASTVALGIWTDGRTPAIFTTKQIWMCLTAKPTVAGRPPHMNWRIGGVRDTKPPFFHVSASVLDWTHWTSPGVAAATGPRRAHNPCRQNQRSHPAIEDVQDVRPQTISKRTLANYL
ncbi:hypothetical protein NDU88_010322, partial [Pleurodeles waltl]